MNKISFIVCGKNDRYDDRIDDPISDFYLTRTKQTLNILSETSDFEIIFVDWCSGLNNSFKPYLSPTIKYISIPPIALDIIHNKNNISMSFYEYIAKDIGVYYASNNILLFSNPDNLFPNNTINTIRNLDIKKEQLLPE